jgi:multiple sugar transport system permease protein
MGFVAPAAAIVVGLFLAPLGILVYMSLTNWPLLGSPTGNGLNNYRQVVHNDLFLGAIRFTLVYTAITTVFIFAVSFVLVAVSNSSRRGSRFYRVAYFLPYVLGTAAASLLWYVDLDDQVGVFTRILHAIGITSGPAGLLATPTKATFSVVVLVVWKFVGFQVMVLLVGLQAIPSELYEAARLDGASTLQRLRYITAPLLKSTLALLLLLSVTGSLLAFDQFLVLTRGGPDNSTVTMVMAIYNTAFSSFSLGKAATLSVLLLIGLLVLNGIQLRLIRGRDR